MANREQRANKEKKKPKQDKKKKDATGSSPFASQGPGQTKGAQSAGPGAKK